MIPNYVLNALLLLIKCGIQGGTKALPVCIVCLATVPCAVQTFAEPPTVEEIFPAGFTRDTSVPASIVGKLESWPLKTWVSCPGVEIFTQTNKGQLTISVKAGAPLGPHLVRFYNEDGSSLPRIIVIADNSETLEKEPNDFYAEPQRIETMPMTINGRLGKAGDVDCYAVNLLQGQWLEAELDAYTLASKVDALFRLVTPQGVQLAWNHDFICLDPRLIWQAPSTASYIVQVMGFKYPAESDVRLTGGDGCVYRLHLNALPSPPQLIQDGLFEHEPNGAITNAAMLSLPATIHGTIACPGDQDWFAFQAEKDQWLQITLDAASLGSPLDARIKLMDGQGRELARAEGSGQFHDPHLDWKAATNQTCYLAIANILHRGSVSHEYRLSLRHAFPDYKATVTTSAFIVHGGETNEIKLQIGRQYGFNHKLTARIEGLPDGINADPVEVAPDAKEASLRMVIAPEVKASQRPIHIVLSDSKSSEVKWVTASLVSASEENGVPGGFSKLLVESTDELWLTVKPKASQTH